MVLRSILFALLFYPGTAFYVVSGFPMALFGPRALRRHVRRWTLFNHWLVTKLMGIGIEYEGEIPAGSYLIAFKHQSMVETLEVVLIADSPVIVLKRELVDIPLLGGVMRRYGVIPVDRQAGSKALREMLVAGRLAKAEGRSVAIFPEGTRVPPGAMPPLRSGFAGLYRALGLPVIPVAVDSGRAWTRTLVKRRGRIRFKVCEPIPPGLPREEIEARVHEAINLFELAA